VIVVKMQTQKRQTYLQSTLSKLLIQPLLSKNKDRDALTFKSRYELQQTDKSLSKNHINTTHKIDQKRELLSQTP